MQATRYHRKHRGMYQDGEVDELIRSVIMQGKLVKFTVSGHKQPTRKKSQRGEVWGLSPTARLRLLRQIARVSWQELPSGQFVTLTLPDERAATPYKILTMWRHHWMRDVESRVGRQVPILWRKEPIDRKSGIHTGKLVCHFHLSVFTERKLTEDFVTERWKTAMAWEGYSRNDVRPMKDGLHAALYAAKYMAKNDEDSILVNLPYLTKPGRMWGWHRPELIPYCHETTMSGITPETFREMLQTACCIRGKTLESDLEGQTCIGPIADAVKEAVLKIALDREVNDC